MQTTMVDQVAEMIRPAGIAAFAHHGIQATDDELWKSFQGLAHEVFKNIEQRRPMGT